MRCVMKNKKGFTLTEIIVVLVILAVLAAFAIPTMLNCQSFTGVFVRHPAQGYCSALWNPIRITPGLNINAFTEENYGDEAHLCPGGGVCYGYSYYESEDHAVGVMYCSEHTTVADGRLYLDTLVLLDKIKDMSDEEIRKYLGITNSNFSNDTFRAKILKENGGEWELMPQTVLVKPIKSSSDLRVQAYFFEIIGKNP